MQYPGDPNPEFSLTTTFAPNRRETLAAFMSVNSDPQSPDFGQIRVLEVGRNSSLPGPSQMQNQFNSDTSVAEQFRLLQGGASEIELGNLLVLPVANGFMYVEPVYVRATAGASPYPLLRKVLVSFGTNIAMENTFQQSLASLIRQEGGTFPGGGGGGGGENPNASAQQRLVAALDAARKAYEDGQQALQDGDFAAYGAAQQRLKKALERADAAAAELGIKPPSEAATPTPSPTPSESAAAGNA
jgi:uncharacterized membrane protein (UPF0182 family)